MPDNFSLDNILAEIDAKKANKSDSPDSGNKNKKASENEYSVTSIIGAANEIDKVIGSSKKSSKDKRRDNKSPDLSISAIIGKSEAKPDEKKKEEPKKEQKAEQKTEEKREEKKEEKREQSKNEPASQVKSPEPADSKEANEKISQAPKAKEKFKTDFIANIAKKLTDSSDEQKKEEAKKETKKEEPKPQKNQEYNTEQRRLINSQLEAEESFENPEELIDAINPFDVKSKAADMAAALGGDTQGIAGNELKQLASSTAKGKSKDKPKLVDKTTKIDIDPKKETAKTAENLKISDVAVSMPVGTADPDNFDEDVKVFASSAPTVETTAPVKEYIPQNEKAAKSDKKLSEKEKRSNDALLTKLNQALSKKHEEENKKRRTQGLSQTANQDSGLITPSGKLNLDGQKIIMATGVIPDTEVKEKSKRKLRDFVMDSEEEAEKEDEDFESYDSTGQIWADLCESHKVIKIRLLLLFAVSVFMTFVSLMGDMGNGMVFNFFGNNVTFLDRRDDVQGFLFYNLILGVVMAILCSSVISNGIAKIFKLKADCDSVCAVTMLMSIISGAVNITNSDSVLTSHAYIYIPAAITGLMFNTLGKLIMIRRAKRNFRFISGDSAKYSASIADDQHAFSLTRGVVSEVPCLAAMRKTELLTDFLKSSYCEDKADRLCKNLVPASLGAALLMSVIAFVLPSSENGFQYNIYYALTVFTAILSVAAPFSIMFVINVPLTRAGLALAKTESVILGYQAAEDFSKVNSVLTDASLLFPPGSVVYANIKHCKQPNSINNIALDQAIILAASLAIKSGSVMSGMFKNMINDKEDILVKVENCVYEDNLGVLGWYGTRRMIMGNRDQMKRHDIKLPDMKKLSKYGGNNIETIYLSVGGEIVIMFFVELLANPEVKNALHELTDNGMAIVVKTTDSIITVAKIAEVFDIPPELIRILPYSMHEQYHEFTHYVSRGSGAVSCNGTFTGFAKALVAAKKLIKDIGVGSWIMLIGSILGIVFAAASAFTGNMPLISNSMITAWNVGWLLLTVIGEGLRRY